MGSILSSTPTPSRLQSSQIRSGHDKHANKAPQPDYMNTGIFKNGILIHENHSKRTKEAAQTTNIPSTPFHRRLGLPPLRSRVRTPSCNDAAHRHSMYLHKSSCSELFCDNARKCPTYYTTTSMREKKSSPEVRSPEFGPSGGEISGYIDIPGGVQNNRQYESVDEPHRIIQVVREKSISSFHPCSRESQSINQSKKSSITENMKNEPDSIVGIQPAVLNRPCISRRVRFEQRRQLSEPSTYLQHSNSYCCSLDQQHLYQAVDSGQLISQLLTAPSLSDLHWCIVHAQDTQSDVFDIHSNNGYYSTGNMSSLRNKPDCCPTQSRHSHSTSTFSSLLIPCECSYKCQGVSRQLSINALSRPTTTLFHNNEVTTVNPYTQNHLSVIAPNSRPLTANLHNHHNQTHSMPSPRLLVSQHSCQESEYTIQYPNRVTTSVSEMKPGREFSLYKNFTKSISCYALKFFHYQQARTGSKVYRKRDTFDMHSNTSNAQDSLRKEIIPECHASKQEKSQLDNTQTVTTFQPQLKPDLRIRRNMSTKTATNVGEYVWQLKHCPVHDLCCETRESSLINYGHVNSDRMFSSDIRFHGLDKSSPPNALTSNNIPYRTNISCGNHVFTSPTEYSLLIEPTQYWLARLPSERDPRTVDSVMTDIKRHVLRASTNELLRCLANFIICRLCHGFSRQHTRGLGFHSLQSATIVRWIKSVDRALLVQGWSEVAFINPVHTVYLYMMLKDLIETEVTSELELHTIVMACLYLSYSYMGNEISYPLKPFLVAETNQLLRYNQTSSKRLGENGRLSINGYECAARGKVIEQVRNRFWQYCLRIIFSKSVDMLAINADPTFFTALFWELKSYASVVPSHPEPYK